MDPIECPDCSVPMEPVDLQTGSANQKVVLDEPRDDLLGKVGMNERRDVETFRCPQCGLLRLYAFDPPPPPGEGAESEVTEGGSGTDDDGEWGTADDGWGS